MKMKFRFFFFFKPHLDFFSSLPDYDSSARCSGWSSRPSLFWHSLPSFSRSETDGTFTSSGWTGGCVWSWHGDTWHYRRDSDCVVRAVRMSRLIQCVSSTWSCQLESQLNSQHASWQGVWGVRQHPGNLSLLCTRLRDSGPCLWKLHEDVGCDDTIASSRELYNGTSVHVSLYTSSQVLKPDYFILSTLQIFIPSRLQILKKIAAVYMVARSWSLVKKALHSLPVLMVTLSVALEHKRLLRSNIHAFTHSLSLSVLNGHSFRSSQTSAKGRRRRERDRDNPILFVFFEAALISKPQHRNPIIPVELSDTSTHTRSANGPQRQRWHKSIIPVLALGPDLWFIEEHSLWSRL